MSTVGWRRILLEIISDTERRRVGSGGYSTRLPLRLPSSSSDTEAAPYADWISDALGRQLFRRACTVCCTCYPPKNVLTAC